MGRVTRRGLVRMVRTELDVVAAPAGPARRNDVADYLPDVLDSVRADARWVDEAVADGTCPVDEGAAAATRHAREVASLLYAAGSQPRDWRRWSSLAAFGLLLIDRPVATDGRNLDLLDPLRSFVAERYELWEIVQGWPVYRLKR